VDVGNKNKGNTKCTTKFIFIEKLTNISFKRTYTCAIEGEIYA
jgi:hypothetical protein